MTDLKSILDKINTEKVLNENLISEMFDEENTSYDTEYESSSMCFYLNENGTCSDGCSCQNIEIEQECPFISSGDFESCCCFEQASEESSEEDYYEDDE